MVCSTLCDPDCEAPCHEAHQPYWKREHDVATCERKWKVTVLPTVMPPERKPKLKKAKRGRPKGYAGTPMGGGRG